jgi:hypothetical protein
MRSLLLTIITFSILIVSCDLYPQDDYQEFYVVESYLIAQDQIAPIYLSSTAPATSAYSFEDYAISGANVRVHLLSDDGDSSIVQTFAYQLDSAGVYSSAFQHTVLPSRIYQLEITNIPDDPAASIIGYTTVPDTFSNVSQIPDTVIYQSENQIEIDITPSENDQRQSYFIFTTIALNPNKENFTPLYSDFFDDEEDEIGDFVKTSSGIVNEANFETKPNGIVTLKYPWLAVAFYGDNQIVANIIDDNIYDFLRSQSVQLGGSTLSPGEIPNVLYRLDGGIGVFGSLAADTIQTYIERPSIRDFGQ